MHHRTPQHYLRLAKKYSDLADKSKLPAVKQRWTKLWLINLERGNAMLKESERGYRELSR